MKGRFARAGVDICRVLDRTGCIALPRDGRCNILVGKFLGNKELVNLNFLLVAFEKMDVFGSRS